MGRKTETVIAVREKMWKVVLKCAFSTSFGRPPGFIAMALTNSGETHRIGERSGTSGDVLSSGPFWPSLVMRRRGAAVGSSKDDARAWTPKKGKWVLQLGKSLLLLFYPPSLHHRQWMLMVVSYRWCSMHRPLCAFCRQSNQAKHWQEPMVLSNLTCTHKKS